MASGNRGVWAIDLGSNSLKAVRFRQDEEGFEVIGFDHIEHSKLLSGDPSVGEEESVQIIDETIRKFVGRNEIGKDEVAVSIAGHNSFARFVKLPPVDPKLVAKIIPQEAIQQIPFDINEVEWDCQLMENSDSPDKVLGIFAIKNEVIDTVMTRYSNEGVKISCVQIAPMALYNYACYDLGVDRPGKATVILDMGTENTTLIVCDKSSVWQRTIRIGGNSFTDAIADAFKLRFRKAEKLKRTAAMSKYVRQIFSAMKPIYTDFGSELQRSLGFYSNSAPGRDKGFSKIVVLGGGMKLQGLAKYLQQSLGVTVVKPDSFSKLTVSSELSSAKFHNNISDYATAYGLGVQLMGESKIEVNLLPRKVARAMLWKQKSKFFTIAACLLLVVSVLGFIRGIVDKNSWNNNKTLRSVTAGIVSDANNDLQDLEDAQAQDAVYGGLIKKEMALFENRTVVPEFRQMILSCLPAGQGDPEQKSLFEALGSGDVDSLLLVPRAERKMLFVTKMDVRYSEDVETAGFEGGRSSGGQQPKGSGGNTSGAEEEEEVKAGFLMVIEGYSPYENISELLDPSGIGADTSQWGFVTHLENLVKVTGKNFELYGKGTKADFDVEWDEVDLESSEMPLSIMGVGVLKKIDRFPELKIESDRGNRVGTPARGAAASKGVFVRVEDVLFDPMTKEEMNKTYQFYTQQDIDSDSALTQRMLGQKKMDSFGDPEYFVHDHWFRIKAKFKWRGAPELVKETVKGRR